MIDKKLIRSEKIRFLIFCSKIVIFFNFIFNLAKMYLSTRKVEGDKEHLWEAFRLNKKQRLDYFTIAVVGMLDMAYVFLLFWSANGFPIWLMVTLL